MNIPIAGQSTVVREAQKHTRSVVARVWGVKGRAGRAGRAWETFKVTK